MFEWIMMPEGWIALVTLIALEVVLGIDNIVFITVLVSRLPESQRANARRVGLFMAMAARLILLFSIVWVMGLVAPLFVVFGQELSGRDLILVFGGLFLMGKSTHEIHSSLELPGENESRGATASFWPVILQVALIDIVFSLDSVITAVGMVDYISIMVIAIIVAVGVMLLSAEAIGSFVDKNPSIKMLALSFLILIGFLLVSEGFDVHVPKGYVYFAMAFSLGVELLNMRVRSIRHRNVIPLAKKMT